MSEWQESLLIIIQAIGFLCEREDPVFFHTKSESNYECTSMSFLLEFVFKHCVMLMQRSKK